MSDSDDPLYVRPDTPIAARNVLVEIRLDQASIARSNRDVEHEREIAILDILDGNVFELLEHDDGPYRLALGLSDDRLVFDVRNEDNAAILSHGLSLTPFRKIIKDYFFICETYFEAIKTAPPSRIEAIDVSRRDLHNEGSTLLKSRLDGTISVDQDTARRLFTLVCALHWKG